MFRRRRFHPVAGLVFGALVCALTGCQSTGRSHRVAAPAPPPEPIEASPLRPTADERAIEVGGLATSIESIDSVKTISLVSAEVDAEDDPSIFTAAFEEEAPPRPLPDPIGDAPALLLQPLDLPEVIASIYVAYPLLESAYRERDVRIGERLSASGAFDTRLKGDSRNQPVGFYRTYRQKVGIEQPLFGGGTAFTQYRVGRGQFEPWYRERETNEGGEFKGGVIVPLLQGRRIDERRADLFDADLVLDSVEPEIRGQLLEFVRIGSLAYWDWVAAGENARIAKSLLTIALNRTAGLKGRVEEGDLKPIALVDNDRLLASRRAKVVAAQRKLDQTAIKLSLFLRAADGRPVVPTADRLPPRFPDPADVSTDMADMEIARAFELRPEMAVVEFARRRAEVELQQARNLSAPQLDAGITGSQDVGKPTSSKRDKSRFELEAGLSLYVPLQRRKARGKMLKTEAKLAQINAKRRFTMDKIAVEVRNAMTAVEATGRRYQEAKTAAELAERMQRAEQDGFDLGNSDLFLLNAREKQAAEAAVEVVAALADHFRALADLRAAVGELTPIEPPESPEPVDLPEPAEPIEPVEPPDDE